MNDSDRGKWRAGPRSLELFADAQELLPGGVNSPVRAFKAVGAEPYFVERADGPFVWDVDGNRYIDFIGSWGPLILGHTPPDVVEAVCAAAKRGTSYGAPHEGEIRLAEEIRSLMPSVEMMRMVNSGTEATMSAIRLARAHTGRSRVVKFVGCYHGHADPFLVKAGSGAATFGQPDSPGVTPATVADTLVADYNDLASVEALFTEHGGDIAAVIVEPIAGNMGCVPPAEGFLAGLRGLCDRNGAVLVFDEIITGFRVAPGGAQELYGVTPDLTTLGKIVGGGLPVGAYGGKREIVEKISPVGPVYQAGTLSGNPLAVAAGIATLGRLRGEPALYEALEQKGARMARILSEAAGAAGVPLTVNRVGSMLGFFFHEGPVTSWDSAAESDKGRFVTFFGALLGRGVSIAPSPFESLFVSTAHTEELLDEAQAAVEAAMMEVAG
jgi:glutamate-1-semialdehyde 2,1-aminomutase